MRAPNRYCVRLILIVQVSFLLTVEANIPWFDQLFNKDKSPDNGDGRERHVDHNSKLADQLYNMDEDFSKLLNSRASQKPRMAVQADPAKKHSPSNSVHQMENQKSPDPERRRPGPLLRRRNLPSSASGEEPIKVYPKRRLPPVWTTDDTPVLRNFGGSSSSVVARSIEKVAENSGSAMAEPEIPATDLISARKRLIDEIHMRYRTNEHFASEKSSPFAKKVTNLLGSTKNTLKPVATIFRTNKNSLPSYDEFNHNKASLKQSLLDDINKTMESVREQYTSFAGTWTPRLEKAFNYINFNKLNKPKWIAKDDTKRVQDAQLLLAIGYEFSRIMALWRQNMLIGHDAYRFYLKSMDQDDMNESLIPHMEAIHSYISFKSKLLIDEVTLESRLKLGYLLAKNDRPTDVHESDYFKLFQDLALLYEQRMEKLDEEQQRDIEMISSAGEISDQFGEVDEYLSDYAKSLKENPSPDTTLTDESKEFMAKLKPVIAYNQAIYDMSFLLQLKATLEDAMKEQYRYE